MPRSRTGSTFLEWMGIPYPTCPRRSRRSHPSVGDRRNPLSGRCRCRFWCCCAARAGTHIPGLRAHVGCPRCKVRPEPGKRSADSGGNHLSQAWHGAILTTNGTSCSSAPGPHIPAPAATGHLSRKPQRDRGTSPVSDRTRPHKSGNC